MSLFNTGIRPAIDAYLKAESEKVRDYGDYWSASSAGYCQRKLIMERLGVPPVAELDERRTRVFEAGDIFHSWIQGITRSSGLSVAQELELQDETLMIRGHIDDLVLVDGKLILYDFKTVHSKSFHWSKKNGAQVSYYHKMQVGTYMYMLRSYKLDTSMNEIEESRILKLSKDDLCMEELQVLWTPELEKEVLEYWTTLNRFWAERKLPPCTCNNHEGGFMAREAFNPFYYEGEPCSLAWLKRWRTENALKNAG